MGVGCTLKIESIGSQPSLLLRLTLLVLETAFLQDSQLAYTRVSLLNKQSLWAITLGALLWVKLVFHILHKTNCRWTFNSNFNSYSLKAVVFSKFQYIVLQGIDYVTFFFVVGCRI